MNNKAFVVRFFSDGGFRVEGPFPPQQVEVHCHKQDCFPVWHDTLVAVWAAPVPVAAMQEYEPIIQKHIARLSTRPYQPFKAAHYWAQLDRQWQADEEDEDKQG